MAGLPTSPLAAFQAQPAARPPAGGWQSLAFYVSVRNIYSAQTCSKDLRYLMVCTSHNLHILYIKSCKKSEATSIDQVGSKHIYEGDGSHAFDLCTSASRSQKSQVNLTGEGIYSKYNVFS